MTTLLIAGATGKTGREVLIQALTLGFHVRVIVRAANRLPDEVSQHPRLTVIEANILDLSDDELTIAVDGCTAVVSCLGHVLSVRGLFGAPRQLCTEATRRLCAAIARTNPKTPIKFILMNSVGVSNPNQHEPRTWVERSVLTLLRWFMPPHRDNETAAQHLRETYSSEHPFVSWCSVRPDSLINAEISSYQTVSSPVTGLFSGRPTSRANVAHFMTHLIHDPHVWEQWKYQTPVIMNA